MRYRRMRAGRSYDRSWGMSAYNKRLLLKKTEEPHARPCWQSIPLWDQLLIKNGIRWIVLAKLIFVIIAIVLTITSLWDWKKNVNFNWLITTRAMDLLRVNTFTILNFCRLFTFLSCNLKRERETEEERKWTTILLTSIRKTETLLRMGMVAKVIRKITHFIFNAI